MGAVQYAVFAILSEVIYAAYGTGGYNESTNYISDLGATCPTHGPCYIPPSAYLYDATVAILGIFLLLGAYYLQRTFQYKPATALVALTGIGAIGVGLFPETAGILHPLFSLVAFLFAGLTALVTANFQRKPLFYFSIILGVVTLVALVLYVGGIYAGLGAGGMERVVVWPVLLWSIGFGGHLMAMDDPKA